MLRCQKCGREIDEGIYCFGCEIQLTDDNTKSKHEALQNNIFNSYSSADINDSETLNLIRKKELEANKLVTKFPSGMHIYTYKYLYNGATYSGKWKEGLHHGKGRLVGTDGTLLYEGDWVDGQMEGFGRDSTYSGEFENNQRNGYGVEYFTNSKNETICYEGEWKDGNKEGLGIWKSKVGTYKGYFYPYNGISYYNFFGVMTYNDGTIYAGDWLNSRRNGNGLIFKHNKIYECVYKNDMLISKHNVTNKKLSDEYQILEYLYQTIDDKIKFVKKFATKRMRKAYSLSVENQEETGVYNFNLNDRQGLGIYHYKNGNIYQGEWVNGIRQGYGKMEYGDGTIYRGMWEDNKKIGYGYLTFKDGKEYNGNFMDGKENGKGIMNYPDGSVYDGDWKDSKRSGFGIYYMSSGDVYEGDWKEDKFNGNGILYHINGDIESGLWEDGSLISRESNRKNNSVHKQLVIVGEGKYIGEIVDGKCNGKGTYFHKNGDRYEGEWLNGLKNGEGTEFYEHDTKFEGHFKNGKKDGKGIKINYDGTIEFQEWDNGVLVKSFSNVCIRCGKVIDKGSVCESCKERVFKRTKTKRPQIKNLKNLFNLLMSVAICVYLQFLLGKIIITSVVAVVLILLSIFCRPKKI